MRTPYSTFSSRGMEQWRWTPVAASTSGSLTPTRAQVESRGMNSRLVLLFTRDRSFSDVVAPVHQLIAA
jgi:hypothetical protein